jgi:1-acyl-sn-glycerol-3-phosphate acyltransferase
MPMHTTIFHTPLVKQFLRFGSRVYLRLAGWRVVNEFPVEGKCVLIAAPHTSNWDLPLTLMAAFEWKLKLYWLGKQSIFKPPFGPVMRWLGGISVDRSKANNLVGASAQAIVDADEVVHVIVPPEGTRDAAAKWKTGFYYIAQQAQVPIVLAYMDYAKKEIGNFGTFTPTGDVEADIASIRALYVNVQGKHPAKFNAG